MSIARSKKKRSTIAPVELVEKKGIITVLSIFFIF